MEYSYSGSSSRKQSVVMKQSRGRPTYASVDIAESNMYDKNLFYELLKFVV